MPTKALWRAGLARSVWAFIEGRNRRLQRGRGEARNQVQFHVHCTREASLTRRLTCGRARIFASCAFPTDGPLTQCWKPASPLGWRLTTSTPRSAAAELLLTGCDGERISVVTGPSVAMGPHYTRHVRQRARGMKALETLSRT